MRSNSDINSILDGETPDFKVKSASSMPLGKSLFTTVFGIGMTGITLFVFVRSGCSASDFLNCITSKDLFLFFVTTILFITGLAVFITGIKNMVTEGPLILGTPKRLILVKQNSVESIPWHQFIGDISLTGNADIGTIALKKRTGRVNNNDDGSETFVPDTIYMVNIERPKDVEAFCRKRIFKS